MVTKLVTRTLNEELDASLSALAPLKLSVNLRLRNNVSKFLSLTKTLL
jgi:hypothetical protein